MHATELAVFRHKILLVNIIRSGAERSSVYDAARYGWETARERAEQTEVVLATKRGIIVGAFIPRVWLEVTKANFPDREGPDAPNCLGFVGEEAPDAIKRLYLDKRLPYEYRWKRGQMKSFRYTWDA
jgi:uncharacterized protein